MRIARLVIARFGHLSDVALDFPDDARLHVVLGANEAGKSTALAAIGDALFGFPPRTPYGFLHANSELRIDITLEAHGQRRNFTRLKRNKDDLRDEAGNPLPESAIEAFRGSAGRDAFGRMFGLSGADLRIGGQDILDGKGELGSTIFQSSSGLQGLPAASQRLREEAEKLYTPRRVASRSFYQMTEGYKQATQDLAIRSIRADSHQQVRAEQERLHRALDEDAASEKALATERRRLERIRRTVPHLRQWARARAEMLALGTVAALPADAETQREAAVMQRRMAADAAERDGRQRAERAASLAGLAPEDAVPRAADSIDALVRDAARIEAARSDRAKLEIVAAQHARSIEQHARELNAADTAREIVARMPTAMARAALRRGVTAHAGLVPLLEAAVKTHEAAARDLARCEQALAALTAPEDPAPLRRAIDAVKAEGRLDAERDKARAARDAAERDAARALSALGGWTGDAAHLAATPVPLPATLRDHAAAMTDAANALRGADGDRTRTAEELADTESRLAAIAEQGALPTEAAIAAARERRDRAWQIIRRHHVEGGPVPSLAELAAIGLDASADIPASFDSLLRDADRLVDRRVTEIDRIAEFTQASRARERQLRARDQAIAAHTAVVDKLQAAQRAWRALWSETGIDPRDPVAMGEWLAARNAVLEAFGRQEVAEQALDAIERRHAAAVAMLAVHVPASDAERIAHVLESADSLWSSRDSAFRVYRESRQALDQARAAFEKAARAKSDAEGARDDWSAQWLEAVAPFGLAANSNPGDAETALGLWERIAAEAQDWQAALSRIAEMTAGIEVFDRNAAAAKGRAAPEIDGSDAHEIVAELSRRLTASRAASIERARLTGELARLDESVAASSERQAAAASRLAALCQLANVADEADLAPAIERSRTHARLTADVARNEATLRDQGDGLDLAALIADSEGADLDAVAVRIDEIDRDHAAVSERSRANTRALADAEAELARMSKGNDAVEAAQRMEGFAAEAAEIAGRYARLRLASELLRAGLERFRQQQQDPLLRRAGEHLATLTGGRYERLEVDENDDGKPTIAAIRADRSRCPVHLLSEGTRDQLYLALRTAAIEAHARATDPLPFIADDLLVNFDDARARAGLRVLSKLGEVTQTILFTHHGHIAAMVGPELGVVHRLPAP